MKHLLIAACTLGSASTVLSAELSPDQVKFFETKIRPVLAGQCYKCHSQAEGKTKGGLALDSRMGWQKGGESGAAIVPGDVEKSLLIKAVRYADEDTAMPPAQSGKKLSDQQIADLEAWVKMGAPDPRDKAGPRKDIANFASGLTDDMKDKAASHWAYQPIKSPAVPTPKNAAWCRTPVDNFILSKLEEKSLAPSAPADKRILIRRAYFDLIGLPPSPDEVIAFVQDSSPNAFEKVVDHLLALPQYGERWGRYWLDVARYADTRGEVKKETTALSPFAWTYRDYVIKALNSDRPFDQFIKEQIAADQLPTAKSQPGTLAALGFLTEGDQFDGNKNDIINDQIDAVCKGFLGVTATCARCHDHFFDPIPQRDYYSLHGVFNSCEVPDELPVIGQPPDKKAVAQYVADRKQLVDKGYAVLDRELRSLASKFNTHAETFLIAFSHVTKGKRPTDPDMLAMIKKEGILPEDLQAAQRSLQLQVKAAQEKRRAEEKAEKTAKDKQVALVDDKKKNRELRKTGKESEHPVLGLWMALTRLPGSEFVARAAKVIDEFCSHAADGKTNPLVAGAFKGQSLGKLEDAAKIYAGVFSKANEAYKAEAEAWKKQAKPNEIFPGLRDRNLEQVRSAVFSVKPYLDEPFDDMLRTLGRDEQRIIGDIIKELSAMDLTHPGALARANVVVDQRVANSPVFIRGEAKSPGPEVPRQFLEFLQQDRKPFPAGQSGRLQLAEAIASDKNPLTPRVLVNRVWLHHFGEGFVSTPDDLGVMSEAPSHRELCDWLAANFVSSGWSLKKLHRLIMTSAVYQQASDPDPARAKLDPFNRLLWRANVRRLDFEAIRDSFLAMGGKLDLTMHGPPVNIETEPYSPRRSIYGFIDRLNMAEFFKHFDMANAQLVTGRRHQTVVPQQALFRMNSLLVIEQARNVIDRPEFKKAGNDQEKVKALYEIIFQRWPKPEEVKLALDFVKAKVDEAQPADEPASGKKPGDAESETQKEERMREFLARDPKSLKPDQRKRQEELRQRLAEREKRQAMEEKAKVANAKRGGKLNELVRDPNAEKVDRSAMDAWEKYAHALLMTNEVVYVN